jgi:hypothetical protein
MRPIRLAAFGLVGALLLAGCGAPSVHVSVPHGWKPVTYGGLIIDVPPTWPVYQRSKETCGIPGPGVLVGPPPPPGTIIACPGVLSRGIVLTFGGPDGIVPAGPERRETINGVQAAISTSSFGAGEVDGVRQWTSEEVVRFPSRGVWLRAYAPGMESAGVLDVVDQIVTTVRMAG